jgi:hypothetical protein
MDFDGPAITNVCNSESITSEDRHLTYTPIHTVSPLSNQK